MGLMKDGGAFQKGPEPHDRFVDTISGEDYRTVTKSDGSYVLQRNTGTERNPVWIDVSTLSNPNQPSKSIPFRWAADQGTGTSEVKAGEMVAFRLPDSGQIKAVVGHFQIPVDTFLGVSPTLEFAVAVFTTGGADGDVKLDLEARYIGNGELASKAADENISLILPITNTLDRIHFASYQLDGTLMEDNDYLSFRLLRDHPDASDTFGGDLAITQVGRFNFQG